MIVRPLVCPLLSAMLLAVGPAAATEVESAGHADEALFAELPVVLSPARLRQPQAEAPAAVTVIDRDMIRQSGARTLPELLRFVPGMQVGLHYGHTATIAYHGLVEENANRMQVLIDGRSVFEPALARVIWNDIPLALDDIQRIEVIRGPAGALYGANSFQAVVNVITRHPADAAGAQVSVTQGDKNIRDYLLRYGGSTAAGSDYRLTVQTRSDDGFDINSRDGVQRDSHDSGFITGAFASQLANGDRAEAQFGYSRNAKQVPDIDPFEPTRYHENETENAYVLTTWTHEVSASHERRLQAYANYNNAEEVWRTCPPAVYLSNELGALFDADEMYTLALIDAYDDGRALPPPPTAEVAALVPPVLARVVSGGLNPVCGLANQNVEESRVDIEWQETVALSDTLRLVAGVSARSDWAESETYLGGDVRSNLFRFFANAEWRWRDNVLLHAGAMLEDDEVSGTELSPRLAVNWAVDDQHTIRAIVASSVRTPDMFEEQGQFSYQVRELDSPVNGSARDARYFQRSQSPGGLEAEQIVSQELGLFARYLGNRLELDLKIFHDELTELMEGRVQLYGFTLANTGYVDQYGSELQLNYRPGGPWRIMAGASVLDLENPSWNRYERSSAKHGSQALIAYQWPSDTELSVTWYELDDFWDRDYRLLGARLAHTLALGERARLTLSLVLQSRLDEGYFFDRDNDESDYNYGWFQAALTF